MNRTLKVYPPEVRLMFWVAALLLATAAFYPSSGFSSDGSNNTPDSRDYSFSQGLVSAGSPTDQIIIRYRETVRADGLFNPAGTGQTQRLMDATGVSLDYFRAMSGEAHVLRLSERLPVEQVKKITGQLMTLPEVEYAEPDYIMLPALTPNDPLYGQQWHYFVPGAGHYGINGPAAWDITTGSPGVVVAVIDTGITNHADLSGRTVPGYDFITLPKYYNDGDGRDADPSDPGDWVAANECYSGSPAMNSSWHGTHVAGTIGAASNNSLGVTGVNWQSLILPVRVMGKCGGVTSDIADGMRWAAGLSVPGVPNNANPAKVLNISLGGAGTCAVTYQNAIDAITAAGAVTIVAAGNDNINAGGFQPANCNNVITVAATDRNGNRAYYSNYGATVEISAPGGSQAYGNDPDGILSTCNTGTQGPMGDTYTYKQGTSMAAPHVSGVASLMLSYRPTLTPAQIRQILQTAVTAFPAGSTCNTSICGRGIVDAAKALVTNPAAFGHFIYLPLILKTSGPTPGYWQSAAGGTRFYVSPDRASVLLFKITVSLENCGVYDIWKTTPAPIGNNQFSFSGGLYASGTFDSATTAHGTTGLNSLGPICGYYWTGGPWNWSATWQNGSQPDSPEDAADGVGFYQAGRNIQGIFTAVPSQ